MTATPSNAAARAHVLPRGVRCGHVSGVTLPKGFTMRCRLGQLVDVRGPGKQSYLLSETPTHFLLHLRLTPHADGHARNHVDAEPTHQIPKETVAGDGR